MMRIKGGIFYLSIFSLTEKEEKGFGKNKMMSKRDRKGKKRGRSGRSPSYITINFFSFLSLFLN